ncbi:lipoprotein [Spiroplasma tabanidicola]|uniref:Lipoprotein n=1 Tax=Spiroplasma tabanidicola TaxID=324079 RepID=A0A6I6C7T1_9MOLU|nr:lipoprotein [Spiroplasma tabanidicola]QGS51489.1 hypothetical protein STABA_v1c01220 [Spiroplasma tabanidicola]
MKKLLSLLGAVGLVASSSSVAVACNKGNKTDTTKTDLSAMSKKDLGELHLAITNPAVDLLNSVPSISDIVNAVNAVNSNYGLNDADVEFDGTPTATKAKIKATSTTKSFTGSVELTYTALRELNLNLVEKLVNGEGIGALLPTFYVGGITVDDNTNSQKVQEAVSAYTKGFLATAKALAEQNKLTFNIDESKLIGALDIKMFSDDAGKTAWQSGDVKSITISVKSGKEKDVTSYFLSGSATVKIVKRVDINTVITGDENNKKLEISVKDDKEILSKILEALSTKYTSYKDTPKVWGLSGSYGTDASPFKYDSNSQTDGKVTLPGTPIGWFNALFTSTVVLSVKVNKIQTS